MPDSDPAATAKARVSLSLAMPPPDRPTLGRRVYQDLGKFFGGDGPFERMTVDGALAVLAEATGDKRNLDLVRADAIMDVYAHRSPDDLESGSDDALREVAGVLLDYTGEPDTEDDATTDLLDKLDTASRERDKTKRWDYLRKNASTLISADVLLAPHPQCHGEKVKFGQKRNEFAAEITTGFTISRDGRTIDALAANLVPSAWPVCNHFFCRLAFCPERASDVPGGRNVELTPEDTRWAGVYHEVVGTCSEDGEGSVKNVFLDVRWSRTADTLSLSYDLLDSTPQADVEVDKGYVTVEVGANDITVSTQKLLRFRKDSGYADGHSLALLACPMGWLDFVVGMVVCAGRENTIFDPGGVTPPFDVAECLARARTMADRYSDLFDQARSVRAGGNVAEGSISLLANLGIAAIGDAIGLGKELADNSRSLLGTPPSAATTTRPTAGATGTQPD